MHCESPGPSSLMPAPVRNEMSLAQYGYHILPDIIGNLLYEISEIRMILTEN